MGVTKNAIFGAAPAAERATPGSYGERPGGYRLPEATRLGSVRLQVASLALLARLVVVLVVGVVVAIRVVLDEAEVHRHLAHRAGHAG